MLSSLLYMGSMHLQSKWPGGLQMIYYEGETSFCFPAFTQIFFIPFLAMCFIALNVVNVLVFFFNAEQSSSVAYGTEIILSYCYIGVL